jgi:phosphopantothenoylcysteine decarboxylase/phosphopantothenate--cysteine ligase
MYQTVMQHVGTQAIFLAAASVCDHRPRDYHAQKLKKTSCSNEAIELEGNPDIVADVGKLTKRPFVVGFAAETDNMLAYAKSKLHYKNLDMIVANQVGQPGQGFASDENAATVLWRHDQQPFAKMPKSQLAWHIIELVANRYERNNSIKNS